LNFSTLPREKRVGSSCSKKFAHEYRAPRPRARTDRLMEDARNQPEPPAVEIDSDDGQALTTINLANPTDVNLLCRAVAAKWAISEHVRAQVRAQLPAALASDERYSDKQLNKLKSLAVAMGMGHLIDNGVAKAAPCCRQKRNPARRQLRALGRQRAREALHARVIAPKGT
jgi:hypothetical protein